MNHQATLVVEKGNDAGRAFELELPATIGRGTTCDVMLQDADASRQHCIIEHDAGEYTLRDTRSANGTFLNGNRVNSVALRSNDLIQVGESLLRFVLGAASRPAERAQVLAVAKPTLSEPPFHGVGSDASADALAQALTKYKVLYQVSMLLGQAQRLDEFYPLVLEQLLEVFTADEAALLFGATPESVLLVASKARPGISASPLVSTTVLKRVYAGEATLVLDAALDDRLYGAESVLGKSVRSLMCAPLTHHGAVLGALQLESTRRIGAFDSNDLQLFAAIAQQVAGSLAALTAAKQRDDAVERARWRRAFAHDVAERQMRQPNVGPGQRRRVVALAADLRSLSELVTVGAPDALLAALNATLEPLVETVFAHGGSVASLGGEGLLALWGVHEEHHDDAAKATKAGLQLAAKYTAAARLAGLPSRYQQLSLGLAMGEAVVGIVGVSVRTDFSAFGAPVDEAHRLAGFATGEVVVSEAVRRELGVMVHGTERPQGFVVSAWVD